MMTFTCCSGVIEVYPGDRYPVNLRALRVPSLAEDVRRLHAPDCHIMLFDPDGALASRASCWWTGVPAFEGERAGVIGHYAAADADAAAVLLRHACARLEAAGCRWAVGPMDGDTWGRYRLVTDAGHEPAFFLEPWTSDRCLTEWTAAGFKAIAEYSSAVTPDLSRTDPRIERAFGRFDAAGLVLRSLDAADPERDLRRLFALSMWAFRRNFFFAEITEATFMEQCRRLLPVVRPELVLLAEWGGRSEALCGFLFAVPDMLQARRGLPVDTVIIKTVAVLPGLATAGLGSVLVARAHAAACQLGYRRAIHALMHTRNVSCNISRRYASTIRRYALLGRRLGRSH